MLKLYDANFIELGILMVFIKTSILDFIHYTSVQKMTPVAKKCHHLELNKFSVFLFE